MSLITSQDEFAEKLVKLALEKMTDSDLLGLRFAPIKD